MQAENDAAAHEEYWQPAISYLHAHLTPSYRVEAVDTAGHWPALYLARAGIPLARGWFRQDDFPQNEVLYDDLGSKAYLGWLRGLGVKYVVLTDAPTDYSARGEAALLRSGRTPLRPVFAGPHLVVYELPHATPILTGPPGARVVSLTESRIVVAARRAGSYRLAVRFVALLAAVGGLRDPESRRDDPTGGRTPGSSRAEVRTEPPEGARRAGGPCCAFLRQ